MPSEEIKSVSERMTKIENMISFLKGAGLVGGGILLALFGYANWVQIPSEAKKQVPIAVQTYLDEERPELVSEIDAAASKIREMEREAAASLKLIRTYEEAGSSKDNVIWTAIHAASGAACAAIVDSSLSSSAHITIPREASRTCAQSCGSVSDYTGCAGMVAIGRVMPVKATEYGKLVNTHYRYKCDDTQNAYDEVRGDASVGYTAYCCCYKPR